jgi:hypothetical protein
VYTYAKSENPQIIECPPPKQYFSTILVFSFFDYRNNEMGAASSSPSTP